MNDGMLVGNGMLGMNSEGLNAVTFKLNVLLANACANGFPEAFEVAYACDPDLCCVMLKSIGKLSGFALVFMCSYGSGSVFVICFVLIITLSHTI